MSYAKGKYAIAISDRSGLQFPYNEMVKEWNGMWVHTSEYEPKAPQLMPHEHIPDPQALEHPRPARIAPATTNLLPLNAFRHEPSVAYITVYEPGNNRSTGDTVRFRDVQDEIFVVDLNQAVGFTITVIDENFYSIPSGGLAHAGPTIVGGGGQAFAGPVTLST
tara:strand:+ start:332 stop:823 length:492 start_codon:yes stop_codon:yes gene_type:complete